MTNKQFLEIIKCALKGEKYAKKAEDEKEILIQAETNGLIPLLYVGVDEGVFSSENYKKLKKHFFANVYNDDVQKRLIKKVNEAFNDNCIDHIFLKGTHLKEIYPESYYRPMGDIDVVIRKEKSEESRIIFKEAGFKNYSRTAEHDVYLYDDYFVEVHRYIYVKEGSKDNSPLLRVWDYALKMEHYQYKLDYAFEGLYLLYHLKKHVLSSGIGIRSVLDITIFFNYYEKEINKETLHELLKETNLEMFFQTMLYINKKALDLDSPFLDKDFKVEEEDYQQMLDYICLSGIHGKSGNINVMAPRVAKKGKFRTFLRLVFPTWAYMKENYPWLKYLPFLLPFAYLMRGFKFIFRKRKYTKAKLKELKTAGKNDDDVENLEEVFKKMGL